MVHGRASTQGPNQDDRNQADNLEHILNIIRRLDAIASAKACSLAQLCLAWLLARGQDIGPVAGTRHRTYLEDNLKALQVTLSPNDMAQIDEAAPFGAALGLHCPVVAMQAVNR